MFVDFHLHTIRARGLPRAGGDNFATPDELIGMMDATGVDKGVLLPLVSPECRNQYSLTEDVLEVCEDYPDRFIPFCNVDPRAESNSATADLARQLDYYKSRGCKGVGEVIANLPFTDPLVLNFLAHCEACKLPVVFHIAPRSGGYYGLVDELHLPGLERCLKLFPGLILIGHSQPFWSEVDPRVTEGERNTYPGGPVAPGGTVPRLMRAYPNLHAEISAGSGYNALTRDPDFGVAFLTEFRDRLFFGTDICSPANDPKQAELLRTLHKEGKLTDEAFEKITWRNADRLLGLGLTADCADAQGADGPGGSR
jgi:predicted TIM-barrel fold metal-dependent hydrolase